MTVESPCNQICTLDPQTGLCIGCGRTGEEIAGWMTYRPNERRAIMACLPERLTGLSASRAAQGLRGRDRDEGRD